MSSLNKIKIYQYGDFIFPSENFEQSSETQTKTQLDDSPFINGKIKTNQFNSDYLEDTIIKVSFSLENPEILPKLKKLLYSKPQKAFFVESFEKQVFVGPNKNIKNIKTDYKIYFAYVHLITTPKESSSSEGRDVIDNYQLDFRLMSNFYLIQDNRLTFIKFSEELKLRNSWGNNDGNWSVNDFGKWGDRYTGIEVLNFNTLDLVEKQKLMNCCDKKLGFFEYKDLYFAQEISKIDISASNYIELNLTTNQAIFPNAPILFSTNQNQKSLNLVSTLLNKVCVFEIEKTGAEPALANGEYFEVIANSNQSGFKITCLTNYCPKKISIFTHKSNKLFDTENNKALDFLNPNSNLFAGFRLEILGQNSSFFSLPNFYPFLENLNNHKSEILVIRRNFTGNFKIRLQNLPTFV